MKLRQKIVAGNWKMNKDFTEGIELTTSILEKLDDTQVLVILGTPYIHLQATAGLLTSYEQIKLAAQNCHAEEKGAFTGEISVPMLQSVGVEFVILGHSERRKYFSEIDESVAAKVKTVLAHGLKPIVCVGEELAVREAGEHEALVASQVETALFHLSPEQMEQVVIAYEPVWAIGTGKTATPEQAQEMHHVIRSLVKDQYDTNLADGISILYGGSVKPHNAAELFNQPDVDGGLIGGASLKPDDFVSIIQSF